MPKINKDQILGYEADNDYYCAKCAESRGRDNEVEHSQLLTATTMDGNEVYYCKDCDRKIGSGNGGGGGGSSLF